MRAIDVTVPLLQEPMDMRQSMHDVVTTASTTAVSSTPMGKELSDRATARCKHTLSNANVNHTFIVAKMRLVVENTLESMDDPMKDLRRIEVAIFRILRVVTQRELLQ